MMRSGLFQFNNKSTKKRRNQDGRRSQLGEAIYLWAGARMDGHRSTNRVHHHGAGCSPIKLYADPTIL
jgi:hypothetical protein